MFVYYLELSFKTVSRISWSTGVLKLSKIDGKLIVKNAFSDATSSRERTFSLFVPLSTLAW